MTGNDQSWHYDQNWSSYERTDELVGSNGRQYGEQWDENPHVSDSDPTLFLSSGDNEARSTADQAGNGLCNSSSDELWLSHLLQKPDEIEPGTSSPSHMTSGGGPVRSLISQGRSPPVVGKVRQEGTQKEPEETFALRRAGSDGEGGLAGLGWPGLTRQTRPSRLLWRSCFSEGEFGKSAKGAEGAEPEPAEPVEGDEPEPAEPAEGVEPEPADAVHAIQTGLNLSKLPFNNSTIQLRTKNEPWKDYPTHEISRLRSSSEGGSLYTPLPSSGSEMVEEVEFLLAGAGGLLCADVGGAPGPEILIVYDVKTKKLHTLPPLVHSRHPVLMHLSVHGRRDFKVLVSGSACIANLNPELSLKTDVYNSVTGEWERCTDMPCPLSEYQTGVFHKDSKGQEFLCCVADLDNTKEILMFDYQKNQWVPVSVLRHIPLVSGDVDDVSHITSTQVVGCGGSIFVFSEQENGTGDKYFCVHEFHPDCNTSIRSDYRMWKQTWHRKRTDSGAGRIQVCPEFTCVPLSATVIETGEIVVVFSEQESGKKTVDICLHVSGDQGTWEEIMRRQKKRPRDKNWPLEETIAFLKSKEEGLEVVEGKDWEYSSKVMKEAHGFIRSPQACENKWGTLLKRHTDITKYIQSKNVCPNTSGWANYWNDRKLLQGFSLECYKLMDRILEIKPRKKSGAGNKLKEPAVVDAANAGTSSTTPQLLAPSADSSSDLQAATIAPLAASADAEDEGRGEQYENEGERSGSLASDVNDLCAALRGRQQWTNEQLFKMQTKAVKLRTKKLELDILKEKNKLKAREYAERLGEQRPRKYRKKNA